MSAARLLEMSVKGKLIDRKLEGVPFAMVDKAEDADVLIIEDESLMQALIARYLETFFGGGLGQNKIRVHFAESAFPFLTKDLSQAKLAVVDVLLPQITGVDVVKDFRKRFPKMGIVPITGMATESVVSFKASLRVQLNG